MSARKNLILILISFFCVLLLYPLVVALSIPAQKDHVYSARGYVLRHARDVGVCGWGGVESGLTAAQIVDSL